MTHQAIQLPTTDHRRQRDTLVERVHLLEQAQIANSPLSDHQLGTLMLEHITHDRDGASADGFSALTDRFIQRWNDLPLHERQSSQAFLDWSISLRNFSALDEAARKQIESNLNRPDYRTIAEKLFNAIMAAALESSFSFAIERIFGWLVQNSSAPLSTKIVEETPTCE